MRKYISTIQVTHFFNFIHRYRVATLFFFIIGITVDIFFIHAPSDIRLFLLLLLWLINSKVYGFNSTTTFKITFIYLVILLFLFIFFRNSYMSERMATWIYLFLTVGIIQQFKKLAHR